jgi:hypothetical protein
MPILIDVDYHMEMEKCLVEYEGVIGVYGMEPKLPSATSYQNMGFYFDGNELVTNVEGGAQYRHTLWDWTKDHVGVFIWHKGTVHYKS